VLGASTPLTWSIPRAEVGRWHHPWWTRPAAAAAATVTLMWYVGGLAIGLVLVFVLVMVAIKGMRKR
jgi:hypothetical protein